MVVIEEIQEIVRLQSEFSCHQEQQKLTTARAEITNTDAHNPKHGEKYCLHPQWVVP